MLSVSEISFQTLNSQMEDDYLEQHYGNTTLEKKKKSRKGKGLQIVDETIEGWQPLIDEQDLPQIVNGVTTSSFKSKSGGWKSLSGEKRRSLSPPPLDSTDRAKPRMEDGSAAGLVTGLSIKQSIERKRRRQAEQSASLVQRATVKPATVYRDKSGRKVDIQSTQLENESRLQEAARQKELDRDFARGMAQKQQQEELEAKIQAEKSKSFAVYDDDVERNAALQDKSRFGDPMAFMAQKSNNNPVSRYPAYKGPAGPANRFGILPGYRWDGIDRGNGYEKNLVHEKYAKSIHHAEANQIRKEDM